MQGVSRTKATAEKGNLDVADVPMSICMLCADTFLVAK